MGKGKKKKREGEQGEKQNSPFLVLFFCCSVPDERSNNGERHLFLLSPFQVALIGSLGGRKFSLETEGKGKEESGCAKPRKREGGRPESKRFSQSQLPILLPRRPARTAESEVMLLHQSSDCVFCWEIISQRNSCTCLAPCRD